jgi:hypothetical protein
MNYETEWKNFSGNPSTHGVGGRNLPGNIEDLEGVRDQA